MWTSKPEYCKIVEEIFKKRRKTYLKVELMVKKTNTVGMRYVRTGALNGAVQQTSIIPEKKYDILQIF